MPSLNEILDSTEPDESSALKLALDRLRPQLLAIPADEVAAAPRVDPGAAVALVSGSIARIAPHRAAIAAALGEERAAVMDELPLAVRAARQANVEAAGEETLHDVAPLHAALAGAHQLLLADARVLARRGLLPRDRVEAGRSAKGYRAVANGVLVLVALFREAWPELVGITAVTPDHLTSLEQRALRVLDVVEGKDLNSLPRPARDVRTRALVNLLGLYEEVRRQLQYVRYYRGDASAIAPSAYARRPGRRARQGGADVPKDGAASDPTTPKPGRGDPSVE